MNMFRSIGRSLGCAGAAICFAVVPGLADAADDSAPAGWPPLTGMSPDCHEVAGTYADPNTMRWQRLERRNGVTSARGGSLEAAWPAFGFVDYRHLRLGDGQAHARSFSLRFPDPDTLEIDYALDGAVVSGKRIDKPKWSCGKDGLEAITLERTGIISDLVPNEGWSRRSVRLVRVGDALYVRQTDESMIHYLHLIPSHAVEIHWFRFATARP